MQFIPLNCGVQCGEEMVSTLLCEDDMVIMAHKIFNKFNLLEMTVVINKRYIHTWKQKLEALQFALINTSFIWVIEIMFVKSYKYFDFFMLMSIYNLFKVQQSSLSWSRAVVVIGKVKALKGHWFSYIYNFFQAKAMYSTNCENCPVHPFKKKQITLGQVCCVGRIKSNLPKVTLKKMFNITKSEVNLLNISDSQRLNLLAWKRHLYWQIIEREFGTWGRVYCTNGCVCVCIYDFLCMGVTLMCEVISM